MEEVEMSAKVLICETDESYLDALVKFLVASDSALNITCYSEVKGFMAEKGSYDVILMSQEFWMAENKKVHGRINIQITSGEDDLIDGLEHMYKFQNMQKLLERLWQEGLGGGRIATEGRKTRFVGVISPSHHNLTVPFSLVYSKICRKYGKVLFVDLGSEMGNYFSDEMEKDNLIDYLFELQADRFDVDLADYTTSYKGITCMLPALDPEEIWGITESDWKLFARGLRSQKFDVVVILFDEFSQNFFDVSGILDDLMVVGSEDAYSLKCVERFSLYLAKKNIGLMPQNVILNDNICNKFTRFDIDNIMKGNLEEWIRDVRRCGMVSARG
jgi:hypothetical protein